MAVLAAVLLVLTGILVVALADGRIGGPVGGHSSSPGSNQTIHTQSALLMSVATQAVSTFSLPTTITQVGMGQYQIAGAPVTVPFSVPSTGNVSGYALTLTGQGTSSLNPQANGTQGSTTLFNSTLVSQISLLPFPSPITVHTVSLWTTAGVTPSAAVYKVWYNGTEAVQYAYTATPVWNFNGTGFTFTYSLAPPAGFTYNQTQVFVPFPQNFSVNYSTLVAKIGGVKVSPIQATNLGIYLYPNGVAAGSPLTLTVTFTPAPSTTGTTPVVVFSTYANVPNGTEHSQAQYYNGRAAGYAGIYILQTRFPSPILVSSLQIRFGSTLIGNTSYTVSAGTITILPYVYVTPPNTNVTIYLLFVFSGGVPGLSISGGQVVFMIGSVPVTLLVVFIAASSILTLFDVLVWLYYGEVRPRRTVSPERPSGLLAGRPHRTLVYSLSVLAASTALFALLLAIYTG